MVVERMSTEPIDRNLTPELLQDYQRIELEGQVAFYQERYADAVSIFLRAHQFMLDAQTQLDRGVHKGAVLYFLGIASLGTGSSIEALRNVLLAYVEDALGTPIDFEDDADRAPAGRFLSDGFIIQLRLLREIKSAARRIKESTQSWLHASDPETIRTEALTRLSVAPDNFLSLCRRQNLALGPAPLGFPQPRERRVFIGTNYDSHSHLIPEMRLAVIMRNYIPVAARDVIIPPNANVHDISLLLLHTCAWAVFDVTQPAGQFMEIERARDYEVNVLLIRSDPVSHPAHVSQMISSLGYRLQPYRDMPSLRRLIMAFLAT